LTRRKQVPLGFAGHWEIFLEQDRLWRHQLLRELPLLRQVEQQCVQISEVTLSIKFTEKYEIRQ
jgi:hypothetical protein